LSSGLNLPMMSDPAPEQMMEQILRRVGDIPPLPVIATKILSMINDPDLDVDDLVSVIEKDQGLTARILRVSNSAFFGLSRKITTVKEAVVTLGLNNIRNQVLTLCARSMLEGRTEGYALEAGGLWDHSLGAAFCAERLASGLGLTGIADQVFVGGLLHDIGKSILSCYVATRFEQILRLVDEHGKTFVDAETQELGFDHAEIGARVALRWNLPEALVDMIAHHHGPNRESENRTQVCVVHIANAIASMLGFGLGVGGLENMVDDEAIAHLGVDGRVVQDVMVHMSSIGNLRAHIGIQ
jgi:putative nucleotidyltransferase with HDIG domain